MPIRDTDKELIDAQADHILQLQAKLTEFMKRKDLLLTKMSYRRG